MKVKDLIQMFNDSYDEDTELMVLWWDSSFRESVAGTWDKSVQGFDSGRFSNFDIDEQVSQFIEGCESELNAELAIDTFLSHKAEEELS